MKKRMAFICDTPYQLFVVISLVLSKEYLCSYEKDLYIDVKRSKKAKMKEYYERISEMNLFSNVYILNSLSSTNKKLNMVEWLFPKNSIRLGMNEKKALDYKYTEVYVSGPFMLQRNFIYYYKPEHVYFFEDGTGSYNNRIGLNMLNINGKIMQKILKRGPQYILPKKLFLFCPEMYKGDYVHILKKIKFPKQLISVLQNIFAYVESPTYNKNKLVYLSQPIPTLCIKQEENILQLLNNYSNFLIVRPHPQDYKKSFGKLNVDMSKDLWELICSNSITEKHILIGKYSTAQLTPKLIFDKEPYIVFTHYIFNDSNPIIEQGIKTIQNLYEDKKKIYTPKTLEELHQIINILYQLGS